MKKITLQPSERLLLTESLFIESGSVELMLLEPSERDTLFGSVTFVENFSAGAVLFALPKRSATFAFLLIAKETTQLRPQKEEDLAIIPVERWLQALNAFLEPLQIDTLDRRLSLGAANIALGHLCGLAASRRHTKAIFWIKVEEGALELFGVSALTLQKSSPLFPWSEPLWLNAQEESRVTLSATKRALGDPEFQKGLDLFHQFFCEAATLLLHYRLQEEQERLVQQAQVESEFVDHTLQQLVGSLEPGKEVAPASAFQWSDPLFRACQSVGRAQGIHFSAPPLKSYPTVREAIEAICKHSNLFFREVFLEKGWFERETFPFLAFLQQGHTPVAIYPAAHGLGYLVCQGKNQGKAEPVNEKTASLLMTTGYVFYESLPSSSVSRQELVRFCLTNTWKELGLMLAFGMMGALIGLLPPFLIQFLFNQIINGGQRQALPADIGALILVGAIVPGFLFARSYAALRFTQKIDYRLRCATWGRILRLPVNFIRQFAVGEFVQRFYAVSKIHSLMSTHVVHALLSGVFSFFYLIAMFYFSPQLAVLGLSIVLIALFFLTVCIFFRTKWQKAFYNSFRPLLGFLLHLVDGVEKIRVMGAERRAFGMWGLQFAQTQHCRLHAGRVSIVEKVISTIFPLLALMLLFPSALSLSAEGKPIDVGTLIAFFAAFTPFSMAIFDLADTFREVSSIIPLWQSARVLFDAPTEEREHKLDPGKLHGGISIERVSFRYEAQGPKILDEVSLFAEPGECVAIVGPSGSGKSTLVRLLLGFEQPSAGSIFYDAKNLKNLALKEVRHQIGTVLQDGALIPGSVYENIICGGNYTSEQLMAAMKLSGFDKDVDALPMGLHTIVGSQASSFCGGQRQRLLITRALIAHPKILILDEATSTLDNKAQRLIIDSLDHLHVTRIVIAHRLTTVRRADRIYVMQNGQIVQTGSFSELQAQPGLFQEMLHKQNVAL